MGWNAKPLCICFKRLDEDGCDLFIKCKGVKKLWGQLQLESMWLNLGTCNNSREVVHEILKLDVNKQVLITCMLWK